MQREKVVEEEKVQTQGWIDTITFSLSGNQTIPNPQYWLHLQLTEAKSFFWTYGVQFIYPARALRALGLLLADGTPTGRRGEDFLSRQPNFFTETAVTPERKVEKSFPRWEINRHVEG